MDLDYYRNLLDSGCYKKKDILDDLAEKLLNHLDMEVIDFKDCKEKEIYIHQVRYKNDILRFKKPLKLKIQKLEQEFHIYQDEFHLKVISKTFQQGIIELQEKLYMAYKQLLQEKK